MRLAILTETLSLGPTVAPLDAIGAVAGEAVRHGHRNQERHFL